MLAKACIQPPAILLLLGSYLCRLAFKATLLRFYELWLFVLSVQAHQWFGDLVTLDDWTELWLNEGFATYFEVVVADAYRPTWGYFNNFMESTTSPGV